MSIDRLRYFATVVETKNMRKAAEIAGISAPSMSKAITVLEHELGHKLTYAEGRGIGITPKGMQVYYSSMTLLEEHRRFYQRINHPENFPNQIRMATFEVFSSHFISSFISVEKNYEFLLLEMVPGKLEDAILAGVVDYGLTYLPSSAPELQYVEVGSFEMRIFGKPAWEKSPFSEWPFAVPTTELKIHSSEIDSLDMWPKAAPRRLVKHRFELLETALQTSAAGRSVLHCPDFIATLFNSHTKSSFELSVLPFPSGYRKNKPVKIYLVGKKGAVSSELERKLAKFIRSIR